MLSFMVRLLFFVTLLGCGMLPASEALTSPAEEVLRAGDQLRIEVFDNPDLGLTLVVPAGGQIAYPLIGDLPVLVGTTPSTLAEHVRSRLAADFLREPQVTVTITAYGARQVHVLGSVGRPGVIRLLPGTSLSALQAISEAGGFEPSANRGSVALIRSSTNEGRVTRILALAGDRPSEDPSLSPGDVLLIPTADRAFVLGRVSRPGAVSFTGTEPITITKAITMAGGFDRFAVDDAVHLLRPGEPPKTIDVEAILHGRSPDLPIAPGDTVFVPEGRL